MRTEIIEVFTIDELSEAAQEKAHADYLAQGGCFPYFDEWQDSLNAFCDIAPVEWLRFDIVMDHIDYNWKEDSDIAKLTGVRAWKWLLNNGWFDLAEKNAQGDCTLTGYCGDCDLFDPIHALKDRPEYVPDLEQVFYDCLQSWAQAARRDMEACESFEYFLDMVESNEWEYLANGDMY